MTGTATSSTTLASASPAAGRCRPPWRQSRSPRRERRRPRSPAGARPGRRGFRENAISVASAATQINVAPYEDIFLDLDPATKDPDGFPVVRVTNDLKDDERRAALFVQAKCMDWLREAGASEVWPVAPSPLSVQTHAYGGTRMGDDPAADVEPIRWCLLARGAEPRASWARRTSRPPWWRQPDGDGDGARLADGRPPRRRVGLRSPCRSVLKAAGTVGRIAPGTNRTCDLRFRKPLLYPLSYGGAAVTDTPVAAFRQRFRATSSALFAARARPSTLTLPMPPEAPEPVAQEEGARRQLRRAVRRWSRDRSIRADRDHIWIRFPPRSRLVRPRRASSP